MFLRREIISLDDNEVLPTMDLKININKVKYINDVNKYEDEEES